NALSSADISNALGMPGEISVRKIQTGDIQPGTDQALEHLGRFGGRSDGPDYFCFMIGQGHSNPITLSRSAERRRCAPAPRFRQNSGVKAWSPELPAPPRGEAMPW